MNKKAIKKIIAFIKMLKAPARMLPYIIGLVIGIIRRIAQQDDVKLVDLTEQGFICRKSMQIIGGCGSPAAAVLSSGGVAAVYACERIKDDILVSSLCLQSAREPLKIPTAGKRFLLDTPLHLGNVTAAQTPNGLLVGWRTRGCERLHIPSGLEKQELNSYLENSFALADIGGHTQGNYYALVPESGEKALEIKVAPACFTAPPCVLSGGETLWLGTNSGRAEAHISKDVCKGFSLVGTIPKIENGRTVSHACCVKLKGGRILAVICSAGEFWSSFSDDMGARWSVPKALKINGTAPNLSISEDGVVALSFVDPGKDQAIRCCINKDGESEWCEVRLLVSSTAKNMRRPYTVALEKEFFTVSRQQFCGEKESSIVFTQWKPLKDDYDPVALAEAEKQKKKNARKFRKKKAENATT